MSWLRVPKQFDQRRSRWRSLSSYLRSLGFKLCYRLPQNDLDVSLLLRLLYQTMIGKIAENRNRIFSIRLVGDFGGATTLRVLASDATILFSSFKFSTNKGKKKPLLKIKYSTLQKKIYQRPSLKVKTNI